jgi:hypothetical protein
MMPNDIQADSVDTREWFNVPYSVAASMSLPDPDEDYYYAAARLLSFFPVVNDRGATYEPVDWDDDTLNSLMGKQANLEHDKTKVVGSIIGYQMTDDGIDIAVRIDREQADAHGLDPEDLKGGNAFSTVSVELTRDDAHSQFYAYDEGFNVHKRIPVLAGSAQGIRRTRASDPYTLQGLRVAERIKPKRVTGVGFVPKPSDVTAKVFKVRADADAVPVQQAADQTPTDVTPDVTKETAAAKEQFVMTEAELAALNAKVAALESEVRSLTTAKETASGEVSVAQAKITELEAKIAAKETELAASATSLTEVTAERDALKSEKEVAARESRISTLVAELEALNAPADDAAKTALKEKASAAIDNEAAISVLRLEQQLAAANAVIAAGAQKEKASTDTETFTPNTPKNGFAPNGVQVASKDLIAAF